MNGCGMAKISWRKLSQVAIKSRSWLRFSPSKVSRYTVCTQCYTVSLDLGGYNRQPTDTAGYGPDSSALLQKDSRAELGHSVHLHTVFPRNLATARFNFKSLHPAAKFRGRRLVHSPASHLRTRPFRNSIVRIAHVCLHSAYTSNPTTLFHAARFRGRRLFQPTSL